MSIGQADPGVFARYSRVLALAAAWIAFGGAALAQNVSPFLPPPAPKPKIVRLLADPQSIDTRLLENFEHASGWAVAYDSYDSPDGVADKWREGPYDLVVLPGPALARRVATGALAKIDRSRLLNARAVQPAVSVKLAAYDPGNSHGVALGWSAFGLLYDVDKAAKRLGGAPVSWGQLLTPREAGKMADCGVALPDSPDALFVAAWRLMRVDPARATLKDVKNAANLIDRARPATQSMGLRDIVGSLARGAACLSAGSAGEADAAVARGRDSGTPSKIGFAYAREGGAMAIQAFAIPSDATNPEQAYALLDFLLRPENAARDAKAAGLVSAEDSSQVETLKRLWPEGAFDESIATAVAKEWARLRAAK